LKKLIESKQELFNVCLSEVKKDISNQNKMIKREAVKYGKTNRFNALKKELEYLKSLMKYMKICYPLSEKFWESKADPGRFCRKYTYKF